MKRELRAALLGFGLVAAVACDFDARKPFERWSPEVDRAIGELDAGKPEAATGRLAPYVAASGCDGGAMAVLGAGDAGNATFDLALGLFKLAEAYGRRFEDPVIVHDGGPTPEEKQLALLRGDQIDCARASLDAILAHPLPPELEARARYLRGNLAFLDRSWQPAIDDYDKALKIIPGLPPDAGDAIGADAAWNRALALRHKDEDDKRDAGQDADADSDGPSEAGDAPQDSTEDRGDAPNDSPDEGGKDAGQDAGPDGSGGEDAGPDGGGKDGGKDDDKGKDGGSEDAGAPPQPTTSQDDRMLDQFEQAPTWQKEEAKARASGRKVRGIQDK